MLQIPWRLMMMMTLRTKMMIKIKIIAVPTSLTWHTCRGKSPTFYNNAKLNTKLFKFEVEKNLIYNTKHLKIVFFILNNYY